MSPRKAHRYTGDGVGQWHGMPLVASRYGTFRPVLSSLCNRTCITQSTSSQLFGASAFTKEIILDIEDYSKATWVQNFIASVAGAVTSITVAAPLDVIKTRIQNANFENKVSGVTVFKELLKNEGPLALFKGLTPKASRTRTTNGMECLYVWDRSWLLAQSLSSVTPSHSHLSQYSANMFRLVNSVLDDVGWCLSKWLYVLTSLIALSISHRINGLPALPPRSVAKVTS